MPKILMLIKKGALYSEKTAALNPRVAYSIRVHLKGGCSLRAKNNLNYDGFMTHHARITGEKKREQCNTDSTEYRRPFVTPIHAQVTPL